MSGVRFVICLSGLLTLLTALGVALYPLVLHEGVSWIGGVILAGVWTGATGVVIGYGCNYLDSVLEYAVSGGERPVCVPGPYPGPAIASLLRWTLCFVSGPAILCLMALAYWVQCGNVTVVDCMILAELTVPAMGYWIVALLGLAERPELLAASPIQVLAAVRRLGRRSLLAACGITLAAFGYVCVGAYALGLLHSAWLSGLLLLWLSWYSAWECGVYALRIVGFWYYESGRTRSYR
jgi:hypothetical protein